MQRCEFGVVTTLLILGAAGTIVAGGCDSSIIAEKSVIISGEVVDAGTQAPLDSAWAAIGDTLTSAIFYSDSMGKFSVASTPFRGPIPIAVGHTGYNTAVDTLQGTSSDIAGLRFELERAP